MVSFVLGEICMSARVSYCICVQHGHNSELFDKDIVPATYCLFMIRYVATCGCGIVELFAKSSVEVFIL